MTATVAYALVDTFPNMPRTRFVRDYKDYLTTYFPDEFGVPAGSVDQYAAGLAPQKDDLGDGTASLQVALQPEVVLAWLKAKDHPAKTDAIYKVVAERVLGAYRGLLLRQYLLQVV